MLVDEVRGPDVARFLRERVGHEFPVLGTLHAKRARRSIASMLNENLDASTSIVGLPTKVLAGAVFAEVVGSSHLGADVDALALRHGVSRQELGDARATAGAWRCAR